MLVVILLSFVFFPTMWIVTGGTGNSITYYIIINAAIIAVLLIGLKRRIILLLFALIVGALMVVEYRMPDIRTDYSSELARYIDLSFGLFVSMFSISVLIAVLIDSYMSELEKSKTVNNRLLDGSLQQRVYHFLLKRRNQGVAKNKEEADCGHDRY